MAAMIVRAFRAAAGQDVRAFSRGAKPFARTQPGAGMRKIESPAARPPTPPPAA